MYIASSSRLRSLLSRTSLCLALSLLPLLTGCMVMAAGAVGAGAVVYVRGELETHLANPYAKVVDAARAALKDLEFAKISEKKDAIDAEFIYRTALDKKVTLRLKKVGDKSVRVRIRVDLIGDEVLSNAILEKIKANL